MCGIVDKKVIMECGEGIGKRVRLRGEVDVLPFDRRTLGGGKVKDVNVTAVLVALNAVICDFHVLLRVKGRECFQCELSAPRRTPKCENECSPRGSGNGHREIQRASERDHGFDRERWPLFLCRRSNDL